MQVNFLNQANPNIGMVIGKEALVPVQVPASLPAPVPVQVPSQVPTQVPAAPPAPVPSAPGGPPAWALQLTQGLTQSMNMMNQKVDGLGVLRQEVESHMQQQTQFLGNLQQKVSQLEQQIQEGAGAGAPPPPTTQYFAVANGRKGSRIYTTLEAALSAMEGSPPKGTMQVFDNYPDAEAWIKANHEEESPEAPRQYYAVFNGLGGNLVYQDLDQAYQAFTGRPDSKWRVFPTYQEGCQWLASQSSAQVPQAPPSSMEAPSPLEADMFNPTSGSREPPLPSWGIDDSTGQEDEAYGMNINMGAAHILKHIVPPGMQPRDVEELAGIMIDAVAVPGKDTCADESEGLAQVMGFAFAELGQTAHLANSGQNQRKNWKWQNTKNLSLKKVEDLEELGELATEAQAAKKKILIRLADMQKAIFLKYPWSKFLIESWSKKGPITQLCTETLEAYLSLLIHLRTLGINSGWKQAKFEADEHIKKLDQIRADSNSRVECLLRNYTYLRDGQEANWYSSKLDHKRVMLCMATSNGGAAAPWTCKKCGTGILHPEGQPCPFKSLSNKEALKRVTQILGGHLGLADEDRGKNS